MKKSLFFLISFLMIGMALFAQTSITLTFTGRDQHNAHVRLDNVTIQNLTRGWTEAIFFPDTVYTLTVGTGIEDYAQGNEMQVMPNPFNGKTQLNLYSVKGEPARMVIVDITGKKCAEYQGNLSQGDNYFEISLTTPQTYVLSVQTSDGVHSVKMVNTGRAGTNQISLVGGESNVAKVKICSSKSHIFELGDEMRYTGYSQQSNGLIPSAPITQQQSESEVITLNFELNNDAELPIVATVAVSNIGSNTATTGGNVFSDGGATVTARGVCYSVVPNPTLVESHTTDGTGTGAFTSSLTNLVENTTYYVRAYATNSAGTAYGQEVSFTTQTGSSTGQSCPGTPTVTDYDGNIYNTVQIGNQCWMKENLRTTRYSDGTGIALGSSTSTTTPYRYYPNNASSNVSTYGYLYNWSAVMHGASSSSATPSGVQGICPNGWHVPSDAEWTQLVNYVGSQSQYQCNGSNTKIAKALASTTGWSSSTETCSVGNNPSSNNATGFSAFPAGYYIGNYYGFGNDADFWSSTENYSGDAWLRGLYYYNAYVARGNYDKGYGFSVRCVRDNSSGGTASLSTVTTYAVSSITATSATCGGDVTSDGGAAVTARGVCWSDLPNPTVSNSYTTDGIGTGIFTSSLTGLSANTTYYVRSYATNSAGTAYGSEVSFTTMNSGSTPEGLPCPEAATVTDIDNNTYNTVQIGTQCWMKENLRTTRYADGTGIALGSIPNTTTAYRYYPDNNSANVSTYGYLYNWPAVMHGASSSSANPSGVQGICPNGWHVPSDAEWTQLTDHVSGQSQYVCGGDSTKIAKSLASTTGWSSSTDACAVGNNPGANNATGFSAFPAGGYNGNYLGFGGGAYFWSSTELDSGYAWVRRLYYFTAIVYRDYYYDYKDRGFSVRCVRDNGGTVSLPTVTTYAVSSITATSATCGGNVTSDGGDAVTARGVCWSDLPNPTVNNSHTIDGSGTGIFTSSLTELSANTTYYVRSYATNSVGTAYGQEVSFTTQTGSSTGQSCPGTPTVTDYDGNIYNTVQIGNQCWMKENLRTTRYADGTGIALGSSSSTTTPYRYYPNGDSSNVSTYGYLYNWPAVMHGASSSSSNPSGVLGICPTGWHVPSDAEWTQLTDYVGSQSQYVCGGNSANIAKSLASTTGWSSSTATCAVGNNPGANNATGFSAIPAGYYYGGYSSFGYGAYFWSSTERNGGDTWIRDLYYNGANVPRYDDDKGDGYSVRCVRD